MQGQSDELLGRILEPWIRETSDAVGPDPGVSRFLERCRRAARAEILNGEDRDPEFRRLLGDTLGRAARPGPVPPDLFWPLLFPEGARLQADPEAAVRALREKRRIRVLRAEPDPIVDPIREILFTSNILLTIPSSPASLEKLDLDEGWKDRIRAAGSERQAFFYDHPVHIGEPPESNEIVYGLRGLDRAIEWEKAAGGAGARDKAAVVLSVSVTHMGLREAAGAYIRSLLAEAPPLRHLRVYVFTELDCIRLVREALSPFLSPGLLGDSGETNRRVLEIFGVDGEYGRHYSFLKAIAPFWRLFVDPAVKATFKIDLDQVFPQEALVRESGASAFGHFRSPLWGALGRDAEDRPVELGMIAGALVNEKDIVRGLFTPDVTPPESVPAGEASVFYNRVPMALSTRAEMMARYGAGEDLDGTRTCLQRFHVTGGTNGIRVEALLRHRPFTPTFLGRAEDQAYIPSALYKGDGPFLRYLHEPGLIMRHDKEAFAGPSIEAARLGRFVGDLARAYFFSRYAEAVPWGFEATKAQLDPFTGCFITRIPWTLQYLRLCLKAAETVRSGETEEARALVSLAAERLSPLLDADEGKAPSVRERWSAEAAAWDGYYDALGAAESRTAKARLSVGRRLVRPCRVG